MLLLELGNAAQDDLVVRQVHKYLTNLSRICPFGVATTCSYQILTWKSQISSENDGVYAFFVNTGLRKSMQLVCITHFLEHLSPIKLLFQLLSKMAVSIIKVMVYKSLYGG
jgi:hypothetical protein